MEEIPDHGQGPLHLVINTTDSDFSGPPAAALISGFTLNPSADGNSSTVQFRTDTKPTTTSDIEPIEQSDSNALIAAQTAKSTVSSEPSQGETSTKTSQINKSAKAVEIAPVQHIAEIKVLRRKTADTPIHSSTTLSQTILISDADPDQADQSFDQDKKANEQVEIKLQLDTDPDTFAVSLVATDGGLKPLTALGYNPSEPQPDPQPDPSPDPDNTGGVTPGSSDQLEISDTNGTSSLLVIPLADGEEQLITVAPETFTDSVQPIVEVEGGVANPLPIAISFNLIEASQQPLDLKTPTAGGGTIGSNAPAGINLSIDGIYINSAAGADVITGSHHNDFIRAGANDDVIDAGAGDDLIRGGAGSDIITTGEGFDRIYYTADQLDNTEDTVLDFSTSDRVVLGENILASLVDNVATFSTTIDGVERQATLTFAGSSVVTDEIFIATT